MDLFRAIQVFSQVVESKSFVGAAHRLDLSTTAVSRHVAELEDHLQTRLLQRTTRRISLTESGRSFHQRCVQILADLDDASREAGRKAAEPQGTIRLTSSVNFGTHQLTPAIAEFMARHPRVRFDVSLSDRIVDLVEEGFDLAVRIGGTGGQNLVARKLGEVKLVLCAAPSYLAKHGAPTTPDELRRHNCLTYQYALHDTWTFLDRAGREHSVRVEGNLHSNNGDLLAAAAAAGVGVLLEPEFIIAPEIERGSVVPLLASYSAPVSPIYAVYPSRRHLPAKVRAFVDFLAARCAGAAKPA